MSFDDQEIFNSDLEESEVTLPEVEDTETEVVEASVEEETSDPVVEVRLVDELQDANGVTLSLAGLPEPVVLKGSESAEIPAQFSKGLPPGVELVEEGR